MNFMLCGLLDCPSNAAPATRVLRQSLVEQLRNGMIPYSLIECRWKWCVNGRVIAYGCMDKPDDLTFLQHYLPVETAVGVDS